MNNERISPEPGELFTANLRLIERAVTFTCRRHRFDASDSEEFGSVVNLRLIENDYAILRKYEHRCSFFTFITVVVQRMALDYRIHQWGKWHASAEAKRLGDVAVDLERHLRRDNRTLEEALPLIRGKHGDVPRETLERIAAHLPERPPRRRMVDLTEAADDAATDDSADDRALSAERRAASHRVSAAMTRLLEDVASDDRLILQLRFEHGMTVAQIARARGIDQKLLYRRIEGCLRKLRRELKRIGVDADDVAELIGRPDVALEFILRNGETRPSTVSDGEVAAGSEVSQ